MENETLRVIHNRRSIRNYKPEPIRDQEIAAIMEAAIFAPTAMNTQGWHFSVITSAAMMARIRRVMKENMLTSGDPAMMQRASEPGFQAFHNAPAIVFLSADPNARHSQIDCGIAVENIALAAESLGIGSCILTSSRNLFVNDKDGSLARELGFPSGYGHICSITLGYKAEEPEAKERKDGLVNYIR
jgi:nitroreductase